MPTILLETFSHKDFLKYFPLFLRAVSNDLLYYFLRSKANIVSLRIGRCFFCSRKVLHTLRKKYLPFYIETSLIFIADNIWAHHLNLKEKSNQTIKKIEKKKQEYFLYECMNVVLLVILFEWICFVLSEDWLFVDWLLKFRQNKTNLKNIYAKFCRSNKNYFYSLTYY